MLRRAALLSILALPLTGCVTYQIVDHSGFHRPIDHGFDYRFVDPYDRWFYGWRGPRSTWSTFPHHGSRWGYSPWAPWYVVHLPRPHHPRPPRPQLIDPRPMPKPVVRSVGPTTIGPALRGPAIRGEALWPTPRPRSLPERESIDTPEARVFDRRVEVHSPAPEKPRFEAREEPEPTIDEQF